MSQNPGHRVFTRQAAKLKMEEKTQNTLLNTSEQSSCSSDTDKQDRRNDANVLTSKRHIVVKEKLTYKSTTCTSKIRGTEKLNRMRSTIVSMYSKFQFLFELRMESLFLAIDIFDAFVSKSLEQHNDCDDLCAELNDISIACFMIAIKYEEIYPPSLLQVQQKVKNCMDFKAYVQLEIRILKKLNYIVTMDSPLKYFDVILCPMNPQRKSYVYLYLQLATLNPDIKKHYTWKQIMYAISILFLSFTSSLELSLPDKVHTILKKLMIQRTRLEEGYFWLHKKYSDSRFHYMSLKPYYIGQDSRQGYDL